MNLYGYPGILRDFYYERYSAGEPEETTALPSQYQDLAAEFERERGALRDAIGDTALELVWDAVFGEDGDEMDLAPGAPDLLVWAPDASIWFFTEVKSGADSLRPSQTDWLWRNREIASGHYVLTILS
ncbi:MAG: hypothetical protein RKP20_08570 [Candidatus Competibacter sp.]|nr:hypothetical protein [Candidatus Competibacter sp.]